MMKNMIVSLLLVCGVFSVDADEVKSVMEGDSVTLHTDLTVIQTSDVIRWRFGEGESRDLLVDIANNNISYNGPFKDRLHADIQTGDLTITNMRIKHSGPYEVQISRATTTYKRFRVNVTVAPSVISAGDVKSVTEGDSVTLHTDVQTQRDDLILWRFGDDGVLIAKHDKEDNKSSIYDADGRFRNRLKLDPHTGSLIITNTKTTDTGLYRLKISSNRDTKYKTFSVSVSVGRKACWESFLRTGRICSTLHCGSITHCMKSCLSDISLWMKDHHLQLNLAKTELLLIPSDPESHHNLSIQKPGSGDR
ncbi:uncharacterized protein LOC130430293 [Triplophysa dalaica]|uniref:uncharacterized protein LOC130430290 n=1 Tax=Triplophysa dalaica TaxID=1582913 RepID=UPI0024DFBF67|nr:uncharacterized protein LOC130430290 [Triplophysa dalaica]XP_056615316.1 uncharacterized protein LOC130430293 [Triplophysa dalaica]